MDEERIRWLLIFAVVFKISASEPCAEMCLCSSGTVNCSNTSLVKITFNLEEDTEVLDLSYNLIEILNNEFFSNTDVTYVTSIYLNDNSIRSLEPEAFRLFAALKHLYLQNNEINSLHPSSFESNTNLITLDLSGNILTRVDPNIFQGNHLLSWVNLMRNSLNISTISSTIFRFSLNTLDIEICKNPKYSINSFQNIPILKKFNLTESKMFSVETFMSYQNTELQEISSENHVFSKLSKLGFGGSSEFRYDEIHEIIFTQTNSSLICFCARLSAWFWCYEQTFQCTIHISDIYSLLNCKETSRGTSNISTSSPVAPTTGVTESQINYNDNESISVVTYFATDERSDVIYVVSYVFAAIIGILVVIIGVWFYIRRRRENARMTERSVQYTSVPLSISEPLHDDSVDITNFPQ
jgi:Leucine-rich repeat (LRR) protein